MKKLVSIIAVLSMVLGVTAFECASKEMTSAKMYLQQKPAKIDKALEALNQEVKNNPKNDEAYFLLGNIYGDQSNFNEMLASYGKALEISNKFKKDIDDSKLYHWSMSFNRGVAFYNRSNKATTEDSIKSYSNKAIDAFNNAIMLQPDSAISYQNLAYLYVNQDKKDEAISTLETMLSKSNNEDAYVLVGQLLSEKKDYNKVITLMQNARKIYPASNDILTILSNALVETNQLDVALETFKAGVDAEPNNKVYRYNYGTVLMSGEKYKEAMQQFEKALELDPEYVNAIYNLAATYVKFGTKLREEAEAKETGSKEWLEYFNKSLPMFEKYLEITPNDASIWEFLGRVYANLGMTEKSENAFKKADTLRK